MSVTHYRLCFDAPVAKRFHDEDHFMSWLAQHMPNVETYGAGYTILPAHQLVHQAGSPCWFALIRGENSYAASHRDFINDLSEQGWVVDGVRALLFIKYGEENEMLFPIHQ